MGIKVEHRPAAMTKSKQYIVFTVFCISSYGRSTIEQKIMETETPLSLRATALQPALPALAQTFATDSSTES